MSKDSLQGRKKEEDEQDGRQGPSRAQNDSRRRNLKTAETEAARRKETHIHFICQCQANVADYKTSDRFRFRGPSHSLRGREGGGRPLAEAAKVRAKQTNRPSGRPGGGGQSLKLEAKLSFFCWTALYSQQ